jgi:hypothetical protein
MTRLRTGLLLLAIILVVLHPVAAGAGGRCLDPTNPTCLPHSGVTADPHQGDFHGLIAVTGIPWVLRKSAHSGTKAGCGDCEWTLIAACPRNDPTDPGAARLCRQATNAATCRHGVLERLYLSDADADYRLIATLCMRGTNDVVPIGDRARADVTRYLRNVTPPDLVISTRPRLATLAGLSTRFQARTPTRLRPAPFGDGEITETITIAPLRSDWRWGDGDSSGWVATTPTQSHRYLAGGVERGGLTTRWGATYTITFEGVTLGPYDAVGRLTRQQSFRLPVHTSTPHLVSQ